MTDTPALSNPTELPGSSAAVPAMPAATESARATVNASPAEAASAPALGPSEATTVEVSETVAPVPAEAVLPSPVADRPRRGHPKRNFLAAFVVGLATVFTIVGAGLAAWDAGYEARVLPGVHVGGVDLSGLDRAGAVAALRAAYPYDQGRIVLRTPGGDLAIPYSAFGRRADVDALVNAAIEAGRGGDLSTRLVHQLGQALHGVALAPRVTLDRDALAAAVRTALAPLVTTPVDATIAMTSTGFATTPARDGTAVDPTPVILAAYAAVASPDARPEVVIPVATTPIPPTVSDAAVNSAEFRAQLGIAPVTVTYGKRAWTIKASVVRTWLGFARAADGSIQPTVDATKIPPALAGIAKTVRQAAKSAVFLRARSGRLFGVAASADGHQLDTVATATQIAGVVTARMAMTAATPLQITLAPVSPKLTTEQAKLQAPVVSLLGTWTTWFPISDHNFYGANIWIPAQLINGTVLAPGQTFDWWNAVGQVTPARGFGPGGVIQGNHTDPTGAMGGGMCSSSTTLFNAALRAGLLMGARGNHRYYINRYPLGLDATVWKMNGAVQDMSFTNDTGSPILIVGIKTVGGGGRGFVTYQIWGTPDGRSVSLSSPMVSNVIQATTNTEYVTTLPHGVRNQTEYPSNQMDVAVNRVVRDRSGRIIHAETWYSHYVLWNGIIQIGL